MEHIPSEAISPAPVAAKPHSQTSRRAPYIWRPSSRKRQADEGSSVPETSAQKRQRNASQSDQVVDENVDNAQDTSDLAASPLSLPYTPRDLELQDVSPTTAALMKIWQHFHTPNGYYQSYIPNFGELVTQAWARKQSVVRIYRRLKYGDDVAAEIQDEVHTPFYVRDPYNKRGAEIEAAWYRQEDTTDEEDVNEGSSVGGS